MPKKLPDYVLDYDAFSTEFAFEPAIRSLVDNYRTKQPNATYSDLLTFINTVTRSATPVIPSTSTQVFLDPDGRAFCFRRGHKIYLDDLKNLEDSEVEAYKKALEDLKTYNVGRPVLKSELVLNCRIFFEKYNPLPRHFVIFDGDTVHFTQRQAKDIQAALDEDRPFKWGSYLPPRSSRFALGGTYLFGNSLWLLTKEDMVANPDELRLLFLDAVDQMRNKFERLKRKFSGIAGERILDRRESIPENVKIYVWRRDDGKCVQCGSQERLEYDHIIPVIKGGSSTERNIQLLCEGCNRKKSARI